MLLNVRAENDALKSDVENLTSRLDTLYLLLNHLSWHL